MTLTFRTHVIMDGCIS